MSLRSSQLPDRRAALKILGIDPGLATAGYGVVIKEGSSLSYIDSGELKTSPKENFADRLLTIGNWVGDIIDKHNPDVGVI